MAIGKQTYHEAPELQEERCLEHRGRNVAFPSRKEPAESIPERPAPVRGMTTDRRLANQIFRIRAGTYLRRYGSTVSLINSSSKGARRAKMDSTQGCVSTNSPRRGSAFFRELTAVNDEINAMGIDQNIHRAAVATTLKANPVRRARWGIPTFLQKISFGSGAS